MTMIHEVAQRSPEWNKLRLGLLTSSNFDKVITPGGKPSEQWRTLAHHLIAERLLQREVGTYTSPAMERGMIVEAEALDWYEMDHDCDVRRIGFITTEEIEVTIEGETDVIPTGLIGASPDFLVGEDGLGELKCPEPAAQVGYILADVSNGFLKHPLRKYWPQVQGQLGVSGRRWEDVVAWHDELPKVVIRVPRDEPYIAKLAKELAACNREIDRVIGLISGVRVKAQPQLREMLERSLRE